MFIALNSRRIRSIFALNYFKPGVNDRCIKKLKTCKTSFYVKKEKVKALKRSVPFFSYFIPFVLFSCKENSHQLCRCKRENVWKLFTFSFWKLTHLFCTFSEKSSPQRNHDICSWCVKLMKNWKISNTLSFLFLEFRFPSPPVFNFQSPVPSPFV